LGAQYGEVNGVSREQICVLRDKRICSHLTVFATPGEVNGVSREQIGVLKQ